MARTKKLDVEHILTQELERAAQWKTLVRTDAKRTVRALTVIGVDNETVNGDTMLNMPHIIMYLKNEALTPKSKAWTRLMNAGVYDALCKQGGRTNAKEVHLPASCGCHRLVMCSTSTEAVKVLRHAAGEGMDEAQEVYLDALKVFSGLMGPIAKEEPEVADTLATRWATCGLFEALD
ncbi:hypothetical protein C8T65DRAFT_704053, partial [Cerioporus squamosus]